MVELQGSWISDKLSGRCCKLEKSLTKRLLQDISGMPSYNRFREIGLLAFPLLASFGALFQQS